MSALTLEEAIANGMAIAYHAQQAPETMAVISTMVIAHLPN